MTPAAILIFLRILFGHVSDTAMRSGQVTYPRCIPRAHVFRLSCDIEGQSLVPGISMWTELFKSPTGIEASLHGS